MNYILYICIVLFLTYLGYFLSGKYRFRKKFLRDWTIFHQNFLNDIQYARRPVHEIIGNLDVEGDFKKIIEKYHTTHDILLLNDVSCLDKEQNAFLKEYFSMLGKSDYQSQKEYYSSVGKKLNDEFEKSKENAKNFTDLYLKLGFLLGLAVVILLL